jgi:aspartate aminotransferase
MFLADRLSRIKPSPTLATMSRANALKAEGKNILILAAGEPDFDTPEWIKHAATQAMEQGLTKYTAVDGLPALKKAIQEKFKRDNNLSYDLDQIIVSTGGKQVIFNAFMATINPGDEVIIPAPYWVSYPDIVNLFGGVSVAVPCVIENDFKLNANELAAAITEKTKWLILNSPSNPTGALYSKEDLIQIADVLRQHPHVYVMSDDIYEYLVYDGREFVTLATVAPDLKDRILIVNGVSKSYSMTGWRIGYGAGPKNLVKSMGMLQSQSTSNACSIAQGATIIALNGSQSFLVLWRQSFVNRRDYVFDKFSEIQGLKAIKPHGAFYFYVGCHDLIGKVTPHGKIIQSDTDFVDYLLEMVGVAVVPGAAFGLSPYFRISYATSMEILVDALNRIQQAVKALV